MSGGEENKMQNENRGKKRQGGQRNSRARHVLDLSNNCSGVIISGALNKAIREFHHNILNMSRKGIIESTVGDATTTTTVVKDEVKDASEPPVKKRKLEDELHAEVQESKSLMDGVREKYPALDIPCGKSMAFLKVLEGIPSQLVMKMCEEAQKQHSLRMTSEEKVPIDITFRNGSKLIPTDFMFHPTKDAFQKYAKNLVAVVFPKSKARIEMESTDEGKARLAPLLETWKGYIEAPEKARWCCAFNKRSGMNTVKRNEAIDYVADLVGVNTEAGYKVDLTTPEITIMIDINPVFCAMSAVSKFKELKEFNLYRLCHPEFEQKNATEVVKDDATATATTKETTTVPPTEPEASEKQGEDEPKESETKTEEPSASDTVITTTEEPSASDTVITTTEEA